HLESGLKTMRLRIEGVHKSRYRTDDLRPVQRRDARDVAQRRGESAGVAESVLKQPPESFAEGVRIEARAADRPDQDVGAETRVVRRTGEQRGGGGQPGHSPEWQARIERAFEHDVRVHVTFAASSSAVIVVSADTKGTSANQGTTVSIHRAPT